MTRLLFWDVDTLYDFMHADGRLYVPRSEEIIPTLEALTAFAHTRRIPIVASADNHEATDAEISDTPDWTSDLPAPLPCAARRASSRSPRPRSRIRWSSSPSSRTPARWPTASWRTAATFS